MSRQQRPGMIWGRRDLIAAGLSTSLLLPASVGATLTNLTARDAGPRAFRDARSRWAALLAGGVPAKTADPDDRRLLVAMVRAATAWRDGMRPINGREPMWPDIPDDGAAHRVTEQFRRLKSLAIAYRTPDSPLAGDTMLAQRIVDGLRTLGRVHYRAGLRYPGNWWEWQIGIPQALIDTVMLLDGRIPEEDRNVLAAAIRDVVPDPRRRALPDGRPGAVETAANLLDKVVVTIGEGLIVEDAARIRQGIDALAAIFPYVDRGDGFYTDGSFVQHDRIAYVGGYGAPLIAGLALLMTVLRDTPWPLAVPGVDNLWRWVRDAYAPFIHDGAMLDAVRGRGISRAGLGDLAAGRGVVGELATLALAAPPAHAAWLKGAVKGWADRAPAGWMTNGALADYRRLTAIRRDAAVPSSAEPAGARLFPMMARAVLRGAGFAASISAFSPTIAAFEYGNGENPDGWWTGIGMMQLHDRDPSRYADGYWATVDSRRLAGTTTDGSGAGTPASWGEGYLNPAPWVGGASLNGIAGSFGMAFATKAVTGTDLAGRKSWFLLDDRIVAVGSAIRGSRAIETVIENVKLAGTAAGVVTLDGVAADAASGQPHRAHTGWAHIGHADGSAGSGIWFPEATEVTMLRERRTGSWRRINALGPTAEIARDYLSIAIPHGVGPRDAGYAYVLLPERSAAATRNWVDAPDIRLLARTRGIHAVHDRRADIVLAHFWDEGGGAVPDIVVSNAPSAVILRRIDGELHIAVSDPTMRRTAPIIVDIAMPATRLISADAGMTVERLSPTLRLSVGVAGTHGRSHVARFGRVRAIGPSSNARRTAR